MSSKRPEAKSQQKAKHSFLSHLASRKVASSTRNQALYAILFLYEAVLHKDPGELGDVVWAKIPRRLPEVLTRDEVKALLSRLEDEEWIMGNLLYGSGLSLVESIRLRVKDMDFGNRQIFPPHALCHSFAAHLLEEGHDIRTLQELLENEDVRASMIYTHVLNRGGMGVQSPADRL